MKAASLADRRDTMKVASKVANLVESMDVLWVDSKAALKDGCLAVNWGSH